MWAKQSFIGNFAYLAGMSVDIVFALGRSGGNPQ
jgi:hypothetical protein